MLLLTLKFRRAFPQLLRERVPPHILNSSREVFETESRCRFVERFKTKNKNKKIITTKLITSLRCRPPKTKLKQTKEKRRTTQLFRAFMMWGFFLILALALLLIVALLFIGIRYKFDYWRLLDIPHETPKRVLQVLHEAWHSAPSAEADFADLERVNGLYRQFKGSGPFCGLYRSLQPVALVLDPELCQRILSKDFANFNDRGHYCNKSADPLSAHLYNLCGQSWRQTRPRLEATLNANAQAFAYFLDGFERECAKLLQHIERAAGKGEAEAEAEVVVACALKLEPLVSRFVCDTLATCVFGLTAADDAKHTLEQFYHKTQEALAARCRHGRFVQSLLQRHPALGRKLGVAVTAEHVHTYYMALVQDVVGRREVEKPEVCDYMQLLIQTTRQQFSSAQTDDLRPTEPEVPAKQRLLNELASHAYGFLQVGYRYTAQTLCYALQELALQQQLQERVRQEVDSAMRRHDGQLDYACLSELQLLWQVLQETVRLHPAMPYLTRRTLYDYRVPSNSKYLLKRGMRVIVPVHAIHTDPVNYPDPQLFRPERFSEEEIRLRDPCKWLGFGAGPRNCIAIHFVQLYTRLTMARLLLKFRFTVDPESGKPSTDNGFTLRVEKI